LRAAIPLLATAVARCTSRWSSPSLARRTSAP
jgi:hypothetical protein